MRLCVMASTTTYTYQSSSFMNAKIIWRNRICIGCSFHGRTGLLITMILAHSGQVLERPCTNMSQSNDWFKLSLIQMLIHWMCLRWSSRMVIIWYFDNKSPPSVNTFLPYISNGQLLRLDDVCPLFCHWNRGKECYGMSTRNKLFLAKSTRTFFSWYINSISLTFPVARITAVLKPVRWTW